MVTSPWFDRLARLGFIAKGVVYALIGGLAILLVATGDGKITDKEGALHTIGSQPFGKVLLLLTAIGLFGYALWRFAQSVFNTERQRDSIGGWMMRIGYAISGLMFAALGLLAIQMIDGSGSSHAEKTWLMKLLGSDLGRAAVGIGGAVVIGVGIHSLWKAYTMRFHDRLAREQMSAIENRWVRRLARFGLAAHGLILALIGAFAVRAALGEGSIRQVGVEGALRTLAAQPYGALLLGFVALGLISYGAYMFVWARYRRTP
jgi:hypothetical protein